MQYRTQLLAPVRGLGNQFEVDAGFIRREALDDIVVTDDLGEALAGLISRVGASSRLNDQDP
jgi:hypothetical protein